MMPADRSAGIMSLISGRNAGLRAPRRRRDPRGGSSGGRVRPARWRWAGVPLAEMRQPSVRHQPPQAAAARPMACLPMRLGAPRWRSVRPPRSIPTPSPSAMPPGAAGRNRGRLQRSCVWRCIGCLRHQCPGQRSAGCRNWLQRQCNRRPVGRGRLQIHCIQHSRLGVRQRSQRERWQQHGAGQRRHLVRFELIRGRQRSQRIGHRFGRRRQHSHRKQHWGHRGWERRQCIRQSCRRDRLLCQRIGQRIGWCRRSVDRRIVCRWGWHGANASGGGAVGVGYLTNVAPAIYGTDAPNWGQCRVSCDMRTGASR